MRMVRRTSLNLELDLVAAARKILKTRAGAWDERREEHEPPHRARCGDERNREPTERVTDDDEIVHAVHGVGDDLGIADTSRRDVLARQVHGDRGVPASLQLGDEALPAPGAVPRPVDKRESGHGWEHGRSKVGSIRPEAGQAAGGG